MDNLIKLNLSRAYKIFAHLKMDDHTYTHLSSRAPGGDSFYIYPFGLRFEEVTSENLMRVSLDGSVIEGQEYQYNKTGYMIHGAIYANRRDINHIFHFHTPEIVAVSSLEEGLLPLSQWALHFYNRVAYHAYDSLTLQDYHSSQLLRDLGGLKLLMMRNHGALTLGESIQEAMFYSYHLQQACNAQCLTLSMNRPLVIPSPEVCEKSVNDLLSFEQDLGMRDWQAWLRLVDKL